MDIRTHCLSDRRRPTPRLAAPKLFDEMVFTPPFGGRGGTHPMACRAFGGGRTQQGSTETTEISPSVASVLSCSISSLPFPTRLAREGSFPPSRFTFPPKSAWCPKCLRSEKSTTWAPQPAAIAIGSPRARNPDSEHHAWPRSFTSNKYTSAGSTTVPPPGGSASRANRSTSTRSTTSLPTRRPASARPLPD